MPTPPRRSVLPHLLLVLGPLALLQTLWRLVPFPDVDPPRVINGVLVLSPAGWLETAVVAVAWTWAVTAAVAAVGGADRPVRRAFRLLPTVGGALAAGVAAVLVALLLTGLLLPAVLELIWGVVVLLAVPLTLLLVRLALVLPIAVFEDLRGMAALRAAFSGVGRHMVRIAILLLVGVLGPAVLTGWAWAEAGSLVTGSLPGLGLWLVRDLVLVLLAALQAGTFVVAYRNLPQPRPVLAPSAVGDRVRPTGWAALVLGLVALLLPTLLAGAGVATRRLPELSVQPAQYGSLAALAWPAGRHPVLVSQSAIHDCTDDTCRTSRRTELPLSLQDAEGTTIAADGSVYALTVDRLAYCDPQRTCRRARGPLPAFGFERVAAVALAPDGQLLIAVAEPRGDSARRLGPSRQEDMGLRLIRCRDLDCAAPAVTRLGVVRVQFGYEPTGYYRQLSVGVDRSGRPVVAYRPRGGSMVWVARCDTPACASAQLGLQANPAPPGLPTEEELAFLHFDRLVHPCGRCTDDLSGTVDRPGGGVYGVTIRAGRPGVALYVGEKPSVPHRLVLWTCADYRCRSPREVPLVEVPDVSSARPGPQLGDAFRLAANPDGRVIVVRELAPDEVITVRP
ncbi:hypothetical protein GCM10023176_36850 [Micromonospora coerulea]|uniref:Uncharacterized protein n=1 Tax=Micromonospora coerulea TaxID=47856 RepID=A0ABP8SRS9_9ACTN